MAEDNNFPYWKDHKKYPRNAQDELIDEFLEDLKSEIEHTDINVLRSALVNLCIKWEERKK